MPQEVEDPTGLEGTPSDTMEVLAIEGSWCLSDATGFYPARRVSVVSAAAAAVLLSLESEVLVYQYHYYSSMPGRYSS